VVEVARKSEGNHYFFFNAIFLQYEILFFDVVIFWQLEKRIRVCVAICKQIDLARLFRTNNYAAF